VAKKPKETLTLGAFIGAVHRALGAGTVCSKAVEIALVSLGVEIGPQLAAAIAALGLTCAASVLVSFFEEFLGGGISNMACATTHKVSTTVQGAGPCCAAYSAAFPAGHIPVVGERVAATNKLGKCIVCEVKASTSRKHPGMLVFKRGLAHVAGSVVSCPSTAEGCCALLGQ